MISLHRKVPGGEERESVEVLVLGTERLPAGDTRDKRPVPAGIYALDLKADKCLCTEGSPREASLIFSRNIIT